MHLLFYRKLFFFQLILKQSLPHAKNGRLSPYKTERKCRSERKPFHIKVTLSSVLPLEFSVEILYNIYV